MADLARFGWSECFARHFVEDGEFIPARVISEHRSGYRVQTRQGECRGRLAGKLRHQTVDPAELPAVGDWVVVQAGSEPGQRAIHRVLPRKSKFSRKVAGERTAEQVVAANVDTVWIVSSLEEDRSLRRIERYLTLAWESGARPVVVLTKSDLCGDAAQRIAQIESIALAVPVHRTSSVRREGLEDLCGYLCDHQTVALLGSSGVGKSSLINALAGSALQETAEVRNDGKGRHTTTTRQLLCLPDGGLIIDTPGMRELQLWGESEAGLSDTFGDVESLAADCRFSDCRHAGEPGCAVIAAVEQGQLSAERLESFQKLQRELAHLERKQDHRAQLEQKRRYKSIMKSLRDHPKYKR